MYCHCIYFESFALHCGQYKHAKSIDIKLSHFYGLLAKKGPNDIKIMTTDIFLTKFETVPNTDVMKFELLITKNMA